MIQILFIVRYRQDGKLYALKQTRKDRYPSIKALMKERDNMIKVLPLGLAKLHFAFQTVSMNLVSLPLTYDFLIVAILLLGHGLLSRWRSGKTH